MVMNTEASTSDNQNNDMDNEKEELSDEEKEKDRGTPLVKKPNWKNNRAA